MGKSMQPQSWGTDKEDSRSGRAGSWALVLLAGSAALLAGQTVFASRPVTAGQTTVQNRAVPAVKSRMAGTAHKAVHRKAKPGAGKTKAQAAAPAVAEAPKAPELPNWPANDKPVPAAVVWDSHGLRINATNSSLQQILKDVETATGAQVEGDVGDQRIFGVYGPGLARDVLSQLLQGSGYNVLMIGDLGQGAPREIVLSSPTTGDTQASNKPARNGGDEDAAEPEEDQPPPNPVPIRSGFTPGGPPRTPQQIMQEMQQRQQQQQQQAPPPP